VTHTSFIEISESALANNISFIEKLLGSNTKFSSVVKGNAYGHGIANIVPLANKYGVDHFSVFSASEAVSVIEALPEKNITVMIMGDIDNEELEWAIENRVELYLFEFDRLEATIQTARKLGKKAVVHIEVETGMNRTGFYPSDIPQVLERLKLHTEFIEIRALCTHLAGAESVANYKRIKDQIKVFKRVVQRHGGEDWFNPILHMASSAASVRYPKTKFDMCRVGILQYGFFPAEENFVHYLAKTKTTETPLQRVVSWKSKVMNIKEVQAGEFVGYGNSFLANKPTKVAYIPVGYSFGYSRSLSNQGKVLIRGQRHDVIGTVNMSMMAVDVSDLDVVEKGDEAVLIGFQGDQEISVASFGDFSNQVNYELLTRLPGDIPRFITE